MNNSPMNYQTDKPKKEYGPIIVTDYGDAAKLTRQPSIQPPG